MNTIVRFTIHKIVPTHVLLFALLLLQAIRAQTVINVPSSSLETNTSHYADAQLVAPSSIQQYGTTSPSAATHQWTHHHSPGLSPAGSGRPIDRVGQSGAGQSSIATSSHSRISTFYPQ